MTKPHVDFRIHFVVETVKTSLDEVRQILVCRPTSCEVVIQKSGRPQGFWELYYSLRHSRSLDRAVKGLCAKLEPSRRSIWNLAKINRCYFDIGCFSDARIVSPSIPLGADSMKALASFKVPVYIHVYPCTRD